VVSKTSHRIYGDRSPYELPACSIAEAAAWLELPIGTVRDWTIGHPRSTHSSRTSTRPVIVIADAESRMLSFTNLIELFVLRGIRENGVSLQNVRPAVAFIERRMGVARPLANKAMSTDGTDLLIDDEFGRLINVSRQGQLEMRELVLAYLQRIDRNQEGKAIRLSPFATKLVVDAPKSIVIDPRVQFCRPCLAGSRITTAAIADRYKGGESIESLERDFRRTAADVQEAIRFELNRAA